MVNIQQELLKKLSDKSSINEIQSYIKKIMEMRGFNKEKSSDKILLLVEEVGELAKAIRKNERKIGIDKTKEYNYSSNWQILLWICNSFFIGNKTKNKI